MVRLEGKGEGVGARDLRGGYSFLGNYESALLECKITILLFRLPESTASMNMLLTPLAPLLPSSPLQQG